MINPALRTKSGAVPAQAEAERVEQAVWSQEAEAEFREELGADESPPAPGTVVLAALLASLVLGLCCAAVILLR